MSFGNYEKRRETKANTTQVALKDNKDNKVYVQRTGTALKKNKKNYKIKQEVTEMGTRCKDDLSNQQLNWTEMGVNVLNPHIITGTALFHTKRLIFIMRKQ